MILTSSILSWLHTPFGRVPLRVPLTATIGAGTAKTDVKHEPIRIMESFILSKERRGELLGAVVKWDDDVWGLYAAALYVQYSYGYISAWKVQFSRHCWSSIQKYLPPDVTSFVSSRLRLYISIPRYFKAESYTFRIASHFDGTMKMMIKQSTNLGNSATKVNNAPSIHPSSLSDVLTHPQSEARSANKSSLRIHTRTQDLPNPTKGI